MFTGPLMVPLSAAEHGCAAQGPRALLLLRDQIDGLDGSGQITAIILRLQEPTLQPWIRQHEMLTQPLYPYWE